MYGTPKPSLIALATVLIMTLALVRPPLAESHCDTLDGPVVADARNAIAAADVTPVLKWVRPGDETEIRQAFDETLAVRGLDPQARDLADRYFFETLVRIHRAGEGAPYTGLKPAGSVEPVIAKADRALAEGSVDSLAAAITAHTEQGIRERFSRALETRRHAEDSVEAGRDFVAAYVRYVHYLEGIANQVHGAPHRAENEGHKH